MRNVLRKEVAHVVYNPVFMITWKHLCWTGIAVVHLLIAALHAAHLEEWPGHKQPLIKGLATYGDYTGAGNIFSFFAPRVGNEIAVIYTLAGSDSSQQVVRLKEPIPNATAAYKPSIISSASRKPVLTCTELCFLYAASAARQQPGKGYGCYKKCARHAVEYREGARPEWTPFLVKDYHKR